MHEHQQASSTDSSLNSGHTVGQDFQCARTPECTSCLGQSIYVAPNHSALEIAAATDAVELTTKLLCCLAYVLGFSILIAYYLSQGMKHQGTFA